MMNGLPPKQILFPPIKLIRQRITELERIDLKKVDVDHLKRLLDPLLDVVSAGPSYEETHMFYRGRVMSDPPVNVTQIGAPSPADQTKFGRVNRPGQPFLYTNVDLGSIFKEIRVQPGQRVALACFRAARRTFTVSAGYDAQSMQEKEFICELPAWCYSKEGALGQKENQLIQSFQARQFLKNVPEDQEHLYKLSVAWTELMLYGQENVDGITYPSVAANAKSNNIAFKPNLIGNTLELVRVDYLQIDSVVAEIFNFTYLGKADQFDETGGITFREVPPLKFSTPCPVGPGYARLEKRLWVVRTAEGKLISEEQPG